MNTSDREDPEKPDAAEVARQFISAQCPHRPVMALACHCVICTSEVISAYASRVTRDKLHEMAGRMRMKAAAKETERDHANTTAWSACCDAAMLALIKAALMLEAEAGKEGSK